MNNGSFYSETVFDQDDYQRSVPGEQQSQTSWETDTQDSNDPGNYPRYIPPQKRPIHLEMGDHVQVNMNDKPDDQGVQNKSFQKLMVYVQFALVKSMVDKLSSLLPGCFFVSCSHNNHDHPIAHVVTQVGTRFLQRMIKPGQWVLDVYGSPNSCDKFNASQRNARLPKVMHALVAKACASDFIREVNKWGPRTDAQGVRYFNGHINRNLEAVRTVDVYQLIHTLYYLSTKDIITLLHSGVHATRVDPSPIKKMLALIHTHTGESGTLNNGEQTYEIRAGIVKQRNVRTGTTYCHPNITPFWFSENKSYYDDNGLGFTWECHLVCDDTWIIEAVPTTANDLDEDFANDWEDKFYCEQVLSDKPIVGARTAPIEMLPTKNGKQFIQLHLTNLELVDNLRTYAIGKPRTGKEGYQLMKDLISRARSLSVPSALFPSQTLLVVKPEHLYDHCMSAFISDLERETELMGCLDNLQGMIYNHTKKVTGKAPPPTLASNDLMGHLKLLGKVGIRGAKVARSSKPLDGALAAVGELFD